MQKQSNLLLNTLVKRLSLSIILLAGLIFAEFAISRYNNIYNEKIVMISIFRNKPLVLSAIILIIIMNYLFYEILDFLSSRYRTLVPKIIILIVGGIVWCLFWWQCARWLNLFFNSQVNSCYLNIKRIRYIGNIYEMPFVLGGCHVIAYMIKFFPLLLHNKDAATIAFCFDCTPEIINLCVPQLYILIALWSTATNELASYTIAIIVFSLVIIYFLFDSLHRYAQYSKILNKNANKKTGVVTIIMINPEYAFIYPLIMSREMDLDKGNISKILAGGFQIVVRRIEELKKEEMSDVVLIVADRVSQIFYATEINSAIDYVRKNSPFMFYKYLYKTSMDNIMTITHIQTLITEQIDKREKTLYEDTLGDALVSIAKEKQMISFRRKLDATIEGGENYLVDNTCIFYRVMLRGWEDVCDRTEVFSLADNLIKYLESLNHCITLLYLDALNISVNDVIKTKKLFAKINNATFGSWKDLLMILINDYCKKSSDAILQELNSYMSSPVDMSLKNDLSYLCDVFNINNVSISNNQNLLECLVTIRNYTRGHGINTYNYSEVIVYTFSRIALHLMKTLNDLCKLYRVHRLDILGWVCQTEDGRFFLSTYNSFNKDFSFFDYYSGKLISKKIRD